MINQKAFFNSSNVLIIFFMKTEKGVKKLHK